MLTFCYLTESDPALGMDGEAWLAVPESLRGFAGHFAKHPPANAEIGRLPSTSQVLLVGDIKELR